MSKKQFLYSLGILLVLSCSVFGQGWTWKPFKPENQPWSILAPGPMTPDAEAQKSGNSKGSYSYNDPNGFFAVIYRDSPRRFLPWKPDYSEYIKDVRDDVVKANRGELLREAEFTNRNVTGREAFVKFPTGTTRGIEGQTIIKYRVQRFRMFFIGRRFYVVLAVMNENEINTPAVDRYFNSFAFNSPPVASADSYSLDEDSTLSITSAKGVLVNDKDPESDTLLVSSTRAVTQPAHGALTLNGDGSFSYKPEANFYGRDTFTYAANDGLLDSPPTTVTITINPVNDAPVLSSVPASSTIDELTALQFTATGNDIDTPSSAFQFSLTGAPAGVVINSKTGALSWTPTEVQGPGSYSFQVNLSDGSATVNAPISVAVKEVNAAPQFSNTSISNSINELEAYSLTATASDPDIPTQTLSYSLLNAPTGATINPSTGMITWTPTEAQGDNSSYKFTVRASDGIVSTDAVINLIVKEVNSAPRIQPIGNKTVDEETTLAFNVNGTDSDLPANTLSYSLINAPAGATINPATGAFTWTPTEAQGTGSYTLTFRVTDNGTPALSAEDTMTITVNEVNKAPVASDLTVTTDEDAATSVSLRANDVDLPSNTLTYSVIDTPKDGRLSGTGQNLSYTPNPNFNGSDRFTFRVNDGQLNSNTATVYINIKPVNDSPAANPDNAATNQDVPITIRVLSNDTDIDGDTVVLAGVSNAVNGRVEIVGSEVRFTPNPDFYGTGSFNYIIQDGKGGNATGSVTVNVSQAKPK